MAKTAVIYKSLYGFTEKYAQWIAQELEADLLESARTKSADLAAYDTLIFGGGLYAGGVSGISLLTKAFPALRGKRLFLFTVGAADVTDETNVANIRAALKKKLAPEMEQAISIYHFRGGIDWPRLSPVHRMMMNVMLSMVRKKPEDQRSGEDRAMLETAGQVVDFCDRQTIAPLVEQARADAAAIDK